MNNPKLLRNLAIGMLAANILLIVLLFLGRMHTPPPQGGPKTRIAEELGFDDAQKAALNALAQAHHAQVKTNEDRMRDLRNELFLLVGDSASNPKKDSLIQAIGQVQMDMERLHFSHFEDIHKLCKPDQENAFRSLMQEAAHLFYGPKDGPPHP